MKTQEVYAKKIVAFLGKHKSADVKSISEKTGIPVIQVHGVGKKLRDSGKIDYNYNTKLYSIKGSPVVPVKSDAVTDAVTDEVNKNFGRDFSKTLFRGQELRKGKLAHALIAAYVEKNPNAGLFELMDVFPRSLVRGGGIIEKLDTARKINLNGRQRWFTNRDMQINLGDGNVVCVSNQISKHNIGAIVDAAAAAGIEIE